MKVLETRRLCRTFGPKPVVRDLDLSVESGSIYALLGPNGAGKTTTLKTLMNLLQPTSGVAWVLDIDSRQLGPQELAQIGYVSENQDLPEWMTVAELMDFCAPLYPTWDQAFAGKLVKKFELDPKEKIKNLSRGTRMKAALLSSLAYRPRLLVMDEPFSGLDPLVRDELIQGILELTDQEQWTVLISSHDVDEVEKLADNVGVLNDGSLFLSEPLERLQGRFRQVTARIPENAPTPKALPPSWMAVEREGASLVFVHSDFRMDDVKGEIKTYWAGVDKVTTSPLSLREIFVVLAKAFRMSGGGPA